MLVAMLGSNGAGRFFPLHACLYAPLAIVERSLAVYWALFARLRGAERLEPGPAPEAATRRMRL